MGDKHSRRASGRSKKRKTPTSGGRRKLTKNQDGGAHRSSKTSASAAKIASKEHSHDSNNESTDAQEGYILFDVKNICEFVNSYVKCEDCLGTVDCYLDPASRRGFHNKLCVQCSECPWNKTIDNSKVVRTKGTHGRCSSEVNIRMVQYVRSIGRGYSALNNFSLYLNSPAPMTRRNYSKLIQHVHRASKTVFEESVNSAAKELKDKLKNSSAGPSTTPSASSTSTASTSRCSRKRPAISVASTSTKRPRLSSASHEEVGYPSCAVQLDGTWQRRGHASHHGIVTAISVDTGKCVDVEVLTNICKQCKVWENKDSSSDEYAKFKLHHVCKINHKGSAGAMEAVGAVRIFERSQERNGLKYTQYLGDGDSAAYKKVCEAQPYGPDVKIEKLECVGHVQKRCGSRLRRMKNENKHVKLADKKGLGGAGRLTDKKVDTLQNYVGFAIRSNANNLQGMKASVSAVLDHIASTDQNPMHQNCPDGDDTWCKFKLDPQNYKHRHGLPLTIRDFIRPVFKDLASEELLSKCLHGKTQNANECLNKIIWDRCQEETYVEATIIEIATYDAVAYFNDGCSAILKTMIQLGLEPGSYTRNHCQIRDRIRIQHADYKSTEVQKKRRKHIRAQKKGFIDTATEKEGNMYEKGGH